VPAEIFQQIVSRLHAGERVSLCVVVASRGSTPQGRGATMLLTEAGQQYGTLGGGCVEAEVKMQALSLLARTESKLLYFKLDHDYGWDDGLICGGVMDVAVWSLNTRDGARPFEVVLAALSAGRTATLSLRYRSEKGEESYVQECGPRPRLYIAGAGHVGVALARLAHDLEFDVTVFDDRDDCLSADRFPNATRVVGDIETEMRNAPVGQSTYVVIVTRGHRHDGRALHAALGRGARYVGLIGSVRKVRTILADLHARGVSREVLKSVHAPIGLEIGAVTVPEIALSIAAELVAVRRGRENHSAGVMKIDEPALDRWLDLGNAAR